MDDVARYNQARWAALAQANALFTRPALNLDPTSARQLLDTEGLLGDVRGKRVLCLASGGGKQSIAFALLGAQVTVVDLSPEQLARDRETAHHYGVPVTTTVQRKSHDRNSGCPLTETTDEFLPGLTTLQGDMRDLSALPANHFDLVWQPYALNFVPDPHPVFAQVARVLRPGGRYRLQFANPFTCGLTERDFNGEGYLLRRPYADGAALTYPDQPWVYRAEEAPTQVPPPREYRHTLSTVINGLLAQGFQIRHLSDSSDFYPDPTAEPGTWDHFVAIAPPWLTVWTQFEPTWYSLA
ncbi:MAG: SAM-dependent methyltransferase [Litorilinea sp.]|nr:MAG: SAM-dependent methyltransferase [Litorilinea sp.]